MLGYAICFIAGGYIIPASMHFWGIVEAEKQMPDNPTGFEIFVTALIGAAVWPLAESRYEALEDEDEDEY